MKIKYNIIKNLNNLSKKEMDFFLYLAKRQDISGHIIGVHNQDVCAATGMCKQSFYSVLRSLAEKNIITYRKNTEIDYDVRITGNDFSYEGAFAEGYIKLNREVFHSKKFNDLKAKEQYLLFELLKRTHENQCSFKIGTKKFYETFSAVLGVTKRMLRSYMHNLRKFFSIGIVKGLYYITYLHSVFRPVQTAGEEDQELAYYVKVLCKRNRIQFSADAAADTARLIKQYRNTSGSIWDRHLETCRMKDLLAASIIKSVEHFKKATSRNLNPQYIHKILKKTL